MIGKKTPNAHGYIRVELWLNPELYKKIVQIGKNYGQTTDSAAVRMLIQSGTSAVDGDYGLPESGVKK